MKIFQVINVRWFNATAWYALYLSKLLSDDGHDVTVVVQPGTPPEAKAREMGLDTVAVDLNSTHPVTFAKSTSQVVNLLRERQPDIVNCHRGDGFFLWAALKYMGRGYKLVRTRGDQRAPRRDFVNRFMHASVADAVVVTHRRMADYFLKKMRTPADGLWLIHGGVDTSTFHFDAEGRDRVRREFDFSDDHTVVGLLGRFDRVKGQKELIKTIARLRAQGREDIRLFLVGFDTAMREEQIQEWLTEYDLRDITRISGRRSDIAACISAMDIGVIASLWSEAIARAALEIMACNIPLATTNVGVMPDLAAPGTIVPPCDPEALAKPVARLMDEPEFRSKVLEAQQRTMSQLSGNDFLRRTLSLYQTLLDK